MENNKISMHILYDNYVAQPPYEADWGFSCLIQGTEKTILFDTGTKGDILLRNMERMKVDLSKIDLIVISHMHGDHTGGLASVLDKVKNIPVYLPASASKSQQRAIQNSGGKVILCKDSVSPCKDVFTTGEMGDEIKEQSLLIKTAKGLVVITGCSHPGVADIAKRAGEIGQQPIH
ncbi:MBL fold metallo-hydrolase, partial [candidate division KSB1 bacterium]|nr:MBL fold metallo-hydrolase [candidate division KSB1 bacterium]